MMNLYSIRDQVAEQFGPVFVAINDGVATRQFADVLKNIEYPAEYDLYILGKFDFEDGRISCAGSDDGLGTFYPEHVVNGEDVKRKEENERTVQFPESAGK